MNKYAKNIFGRPVTTTSAPERTAGERFGEQSPLKGLIGKRCKKVHSFTPSCLHLIGAGAHLGKETRTSGGKGCSPLTEMKISGERNDSRLINMKSISSQLLRSHLLLATLLQENARVLLISDRDDQDFPGQIMVGAPVVGAQKRGSLVSCGGVYPGTCSNWTRIREEVWNLVHSCQFFRQRGDSRLLSPSLREKEQRLQGLVTWQPVYKERGINRGNFSKKNLSLLFKRKPDILLLITSKENSPLVGEAQAGRLPIIKVTNSAEGLSPRQSNKSGGLLELSGNSKSVHWIFFLSALLCQLSSQGAAPAKAA